MMVGSGDTGESTQIKTEDTFEFIANARQVTRCKLHSFTTSDDDDGVDLNLLLKSTKAIITTNQEILERCEEYKDKSSTSETPEGMKLTRFGFIKVNIATVLAGNSSSLEFATAPELSVRDFGLPEPVPEELRQIIAFEMNGIFPDYKIFLGRAVLLHDDLSVPFLLNLKVHLENIQVYLGTIEAWLMEIPTCLQFLNEAFRQQLVIPSTQKVCMFPCKSGCTIKHQWKPGAGYCFEADSGHRGCDVAGGKYHCSFKYFNPQPTLLKRCTTTGHHSHTFCIDNEGEQRRLRKFIDFVSCD